MAVPQPLNSPISAQPEWSQAQTLLEILSSLSYRNEDLDSYLQEIAVSVSHLLGLGWSVVTCCDQKNYQILASNISLGTEDNSFSLHGSLSGTVVKTGKVLTVSDTNVNSQHGSAPPGYRAYLGVPLKTPDEKVIGTICSFAKQPQFFSEESVKIVELFAERAAIAIDNYNLYRQQQDFNEALEIEVEKRTAQLREAQAQLIEKEKLAAIGQFASMIVHEIRNPATTITMGLTALKKLNFKPRDLLRLNLALEESQRLQNLLQEILLYAKPQIINSEAIELNKFLTNMLFSLRTMPQAAERQLKLTALETPVTINGDRDKLKQVMINLVRNAFEAVDPGDSVECRLLQDQDSNCCCIQITNGGTPIPANLIPQLTEPFVSHKSGGTGLGLAIVKQIITSHNGTLSISSNADEGTTISFTLPSAN